MSVIVLFNKPYGVLCQFSAQPGRKTLKNYLSQPDVYPAGRLDADSEGLLLLTADGALQHRISDPAHKLPKTYIVQVEGTPGSAALEQLRSGVSLREFTTQKTHVRQIDQPAWVWPRDPPIRERRSIPTAWLAITLREGKNRQVRRMTAAVGLPTLRLIRYAIGEWTIEHIAPGEWRELEVSSPARTQADAHERAVATRRQPFRANHVIGRAIPHSLKRKKR